jgi:hypothetical protein
VQGQPGMPGALTSCLTLFCTLKPNKRLSSSRKCWRRRVLRLTLAHRYTIVALVTLTPTPSHSIESPFTMAENPCDDAELQRAYQLAQQYKPLYTPTGILRQPEPAAKTVWTVGLSNRTQPLSSTNGKLESAS